MERTFESWIGHLVVLELALVESNGCVGNILKDCGKTLLMKPETGPDVEVPRDYILKIERRTVGYSRGSNFCERARIAAGRQCLRLSQKRPSQSSHR